MYKEKIDAYIDSKKDEMLNDLADLIRIDSQKGEAREGMPFGEGPARVLAEAEELMKRHGMITTNYDNYVVTADLSEAQKGLDILAHLDVVPVTDDWTVTQPFEMKVVDGKIYGRGTADDKGPAIAALYAMRAIKDLGIPMQKSVRLILGSDEECGSGDLAYYFSKEAEAPYTFTPDAEFPVINIEKGRFAPELFAEFSDKLTLPGVLSLKSGDKVNVVPQRARALIAGVEEEVLKKAAQELMAILPVTFTVTEADAAHPDGCGMVFAVEARGQAAHASTPEEGKNALTAMLRYLTMLPLAPSDGQRALAALNKLFPYEDTCGKTIGVFCEEEQSGALTLCFSMLDYTPDRLSAAFDARLPIGCNEENTKQPIVQALAAWGIRLEGGMTGPHCVPGDSEFVKILLESYERYTGIKGEPLAIGGGTYVHGLERGVAFGCGSFDVDNHMHGDDEFMEVSTLLMSAKIFADVILKVCNELD